MKGRKGNKYGAKAASPTVIQGNPKVIAEAREGRKSGGKAPGDKGMACMGRKPRKGGGRVGADSNPFSSARSGTLPPGHKASLKE